MRISDRMMSRNYVRTLQDSMYKYVRANNRIASGMKYENMSDDVAACSRALRADGEISRINQQIAGISSANGKLDSADQTLQDLISVVRDARVEIEKACNMPGDDAKTTAIADQIRNIKEEVLQFTNGTYSETYLFGGQNSGQAPYQVDSATGKVKYNGIFVDEIKKDADGNFCYTDAQGTTRLIPQDGNIYLDVGRGITISGNSVDSATAFKISFSGLDILGSGTTEKDGFEMSNNIYNLLQQAEDILRDENFGTSEELQNQLGNVMDHMKDRYDGLISNETDLGGRVNFLESTVGRLQDQADTLEELKKQLIGNSDSGDEAKLLMDAKSAYQATLTMGATLFQTSLLDFLR